MTLVYMVLKAVGIAVVSPRFEPRLERAGEQRATHSECLESPDITILPDLSRKYYGFST